MISEQTAIEIARKRALENKWAFAEPVEIFLRNSWLGKPKYFEIETTAKNMGTKVRFRIDAMTGSIVEEGYISR